VIRKDFIDSGGECEQIEKMFSFSFSWAGERQLEKKEKASDSGTCYVNKSKIFIVFVTIYHVKKC
jgi:hypothetical protein